MMEDKIVVGLDIGTTKICAIVGRRNEFGKLEILGMGNAVSEGVMRGEVTNIEKTVNSINKAISEAEQDSGIRIGKVIVGIAGQHIGCTKITDSLVIDNPEGEVTLTEVRKLEQNVNRTILAPGTDILHVMPQEYSVDNHHSIKEPIGHIGGRLMGDFHVITAKTRAVQNINKCVRRSGNVQEGLEIQDLVLEPIASSLSVLTEEDKEAGVVLVDIGGGTTDVAIFYEGVIRHTAVIPIGGNRITQDIREGLNILPTQAEKLKVKYGCAIPEETKENVVISIEGLRNRAPREISVKSLAQVIEARLEDIVDLVNREIEESGYGQLLGAGLILTGGGSQLSYVKQFFEYHSGLDVQIGYPNEHLGKCKYDEVKSPKYSTAIGLVLAGFINIDNRENKYSEVSKATSTPASATVEKADSSSTKANNPKVSSKKGISFFTQINETIKNRLLGFDEDYDNTKY
jgi:cell division protein FtsA